MNDGERRADCDVLIVEKSETKLIKNSLEKDGIFNKKFRIFKTVDNKFAIPIHKDKFDASASKTTSKHITTQMLMPFSKSHLIKLESIQACLIENLLDAYYLKTGKSLEKEYLKDVPKSWQIYDDMLVLPKDCMQKAKWAEITPDVWGIFCKTFNVKRIARHNVIADDAVRSSKVQLLYGNDGWIRRKDNGITYEYDITKCMFSDGNITEKMRIAKFDCTGEVVVDLFAGIGYFVLPFLVHAKAKLVYACEWNGMAVEALKRNLVVNGVSERCIVLEGDNRKVAPKGVADRINLGLIPSSEGSWHTACASLKPRSGGWLHIHANINTKDTTSCNGNSKLGLNKTSDDPGGCDGIADNGKISASDRSDYDEQKLAPAASNGSAIDRGRRDSNLQAKPIEHCEIEDPKLSKDLCKIFDSSSLNTKCGKYSNGKKLGQGFPELGNKRQLWNNWADEQSLVIKSLLEDIHGNENSGKTWQCDVRHVEHVKSYAPHIDHVVIDMECRPVY